MFDRNGYLLPGMHEHTPASVKSTFVEGTMANPQRASIFAAYETMNALLQSVNLQPKQWLGGSFVTTKEDPNDIDVVSICDPDEINQVPLEKQDEIFDWFLGEETRKRTNCDSYCVIKGHEEHPKRKEFATIYDYWQHQFGHDEYGVPKGIVETHVPAPPKQEEPKK